MAETDVTETRVLSLFEGIGIELEYMIVGDEALDVLPVADEVLRTVTGSYCSDHENGAAEWSNELVAHVIEFKTNGPAARIEGLVDLFDRQVAEVNAILEKLKARLMPGGAHPWMDPDSETRLWPHDYNEIYEAFNRIFDCRGHGWSNLQSMHINLPFSGAEEFGRLHAAIRLALPILPAIAASSPFLDGRATGLRDSRLEVYRHNSAKIPSIAARVIPEPVFTPGDYQREILEPIYRDLAPFDPKGVLQYEFANARGAIARFERDAIEIRVLDIQECPAADMAVASLVVGAVRALVDERCASYEQQKTWEVAQLEPIFLSTIRDGEAAMLSDLDYLSLWGLDAESPVSAGDLWRHLVSFAEPTEPRVKEARQVLLDQGTLSSRVLRAAGADPSRADLTRVFGALCDCLAAGSPFAV